MMTIQNTATLTIKRLALLMILDVNLSICHQVHGEVNVEILEDVTYHSESDEDGDLVENQSFIYA